MNGRRAAPQVGVPLRIVVIGDPAELQANVPEQLLHEQERVPIATHVLVKADVESGWG